MCVTIDVVDPDPMKYVFVMTGSGRNNLSGSDLFTHGSVQLGKFYILMWPYSSFITYGSYCRKASSVAEPQNYYALFFTCLVYVLVCWSVSVLNNLGSTTSFCIIVCISLNWRESFFVGHHLQYQCCGTATGTVGTVTFCRSGTEPYDGTGSGTVIK